MKVREEIVTEAITEPEVTPLRGWGTLLVLGSLASWLTLIGATKAIAALF
jgi:hypothetical protein